MTDSIDEQVTINLVKYYERQGTRIADQLRRAADEVERHVANVRKDIRTLDMDYIGATEEVWHDLAMMFANLPFDSLLSAAKDVDRYIRGAQL